MSLSLRVLELSRRLGFEKPLRELYKHSVFGELRYRLARRVFDGVVVKDVLGSKMMLDISSQGLEKDLFLHGIREEESTRLLRQMLDEDMVVADVGANIGYYALLEARHVEKVHAFEPSPRNFEVLEQNIRLNGLENIEPENVALGAGEGTSMILDTGIPNTNRIADTGAEVEMNRLDELVDNVDLVRMDTEGYELEIIRGMERLLEQDGLKMFIEVHPRKMQEFYGDNPEDFWNRLGEHGFKLTRVVRHPDRGSFTEFFRRSHPDREVLELEMSIDDALEEMDWLCSGRPFRVFLEN